MKDVIIRKATKNDISDALDIKISGWKTAYKGIISDEFISFMNTNTYREKNIKKWEDTLNEVSLIVAELDNEIVGFCKYIDSNMLTPEVENAQSELIGLYVKPDLKGNGIGKKMFEYARDEFKSLNKKNMILWCLKDNEPSKGFYKKMGGKIITERPIRIGKIDYPEVCFYYDI